MSAPGSTRRIPGEGGIWVFILADLVIFGIFFVSLLVLRADDPAVFEAGRGTLDQGLGLTNTLIMLTSSLLVVLGVDAFRAGRGEPAQKLFLGAAGFGLAFAAVKAVEWGEKLDAGFTAHTNDFYMTFFVFTGVHLLHVAVGTLVLLGLAFSATKAPGEQRRVGLVEGGGCYWHMVDLLWLVLYALFYLAV